MRIIEGVKFLHEHETITISLNSREEADTLEDKLFSLGITWHSREPGRDTTPGEVLDDWYGRSSNQAITLDQIGQTVYMSGSSRDYHTYQTVKEFLNSRITQIRKRKR